MLYQRGKELDSDGKKRKRIWWYRFRFGGRIVHESAKTTSKTVARDAERVRRRELEEKWNRIKRRTLPPTFERASREYLQARENRVAAHTVTIDRQALKHLLPAFGPRLLSDIEARDIAGYQSKRQRDGAQGRTVNLEIGVLQRILRMHRLWDALAPDVHMLPERRDIGRALTAVEEGRLLEATAKTDSACHTATVLALNTAMRHDEIRTLTWGQLDWQARTLTVGKSKTQAGTGRVIPLNSTAFDALVRWTSHFPETRPVYYVFPWCESRHVDPTRPTNGWRTAWRNSLKRAGVKCRFHDLRVTCITKLAEGQASDMTVMSIAGHVSHRMLEHYSRIRLDAKRRALDALAGKPDSAAIAGSVNQIGNQLEVSLESEMPKPLN